MMGMGSGQILPHFYKNLQHLQGLLSIGRSVTKFQGIKEVRSWGYVSLEQHLPSMLEALSSITSINKVRYFAFVPSYMMVSYSF